MRKNFTKKDGYSEQEILHAAIDHLASAKVLFEQNPRCFDSAGYLSHLGIELVLKSLFLHHIEEFPNEHSLIKLLDCLKQKGVDTSLGNGQHKILSKLNKFFDLRYPQPSKPIEIGDKDWNSIEKLFKVLISKMPKEMQQDINNIGHNKKGGRILMQKPKK